MGESFILAVGNPLSINRGQLIATLESGKNRRLDPAGKDSAQKYASHRGGFGRLLAFGTDHFGAKPCPAGGGRTIRSLASNCLFVPRCSESRLFNLYIKLRTVRSFGRYGASDQDQRTRTAQGRPLPPRRAPVSSPTDAFESFIRVNPFWTSFDAGQSARNGLARCELRS